MGKQQKKQAIPTQLQFTALRCGSSRHRLDPKGQLGDPDQQSYAQDKPTVLRDLKPRGRHS